ncbi:MAG: hypothetical protein ACLQUZ_07260 [Rhizomicrobium sp.]
MNDVERALSEIEDIRAYLAASTRFRGIAPEVNALASVLSLVIAAAQTIWPQDAFHYVAAWAAATIAFIVIAAIEAVSRARRLHGRMADAMLNTALRQVLPFAAAGIIITMVISKFSSDTAWMLPGLWQILIGLLGFSALPNLPRAMVWVAGWYFLCGTIVLALAGRSGVLSPWMMGLPFAIGQAVVAVILYRANGERDVQA